MPINLTAVGIDDFTVETQGKLNCQFRFPIQVGPTIATSLSILRLQNPNLKHPNFKQ